MGTSVITNSNIPQRSQVTGDEADRNVCYMNKQAVVLSV